MRTPQSGIYRISDSQGRDGVTGEIAQLLASAEQLRGLGREVVRAARQMATVGYCDYSQPHPETASVAARAARPLQG